MLTPCQKKCVANWESNLCASCGRTRDEIATWLIMTDEERSRIMALLPERLANARR
jgi:predicted Fe-S protein YdhL (DUF1289 family)